MGSNQLLNVNAVISQYFWFQADKYKWVTIIYLGILQGVIQKVCHSQNNIFLAPLLPMLHLMIFFSNPAPSFVIH